MKWIWCQILKRSHGFCRKLEVSGNFAGGDQFLFSTKTASCWYYEAETVCHVCWRLAPFSACLVPWLWFFPEPILLWFCLGTFRMPSWQLSCNWQNQTGFFLQPIKLQCILIRLMTMRAKKLDASAGFVNTRDDARIQEERNGWWEEEASRQEKACHIVEKWQDAYLGIPGAGGGGAEQEEWAITFFLEASDWPLCETGIWMLD